MLKPEVPRPSVFSKKAGELLLSGQALVELLRAVLAKGMPFRFRARGISMYPFIRDGDIVTISPLAGVSPRIGDVVAFIRPETGKLVLHRVIEKRSKSFLIKGDNIFESDGSIPETNILGRITKVERDGKRVFSGIGLERLLIVLLMRKNLFFPLLFMTKRLLRPIMRR